MKSLLRLSVYLRPMAGTLASAYACMIVYNASTVAYAALSGPALNFVFTGEILGILRDADGALRAPFTWLPENWLADLQAMDRQAALLIVPVLIVIVSTVRGFAQAGQFMLFGKVSQRILRAVRRDAFAQTIGQPPGFFAKRSQGDVLSRLSSDTVLVEQACFYGFGSLLRDSLAVIGLLGFVIYLDAQLALLTLITVPLAVFPLARFAKWLKRISKRSQASQGDLNAIAYEALAGVRVVQAFGQEAREVARLETSATRYYRQMLVSYFIRSVRTPTMEILGALALAALVGFLGYIALSGEAEPDHYVSFLVALFLMYDPLKKLGRVSEYLAAGAAATDRLFELLDVQPAIQEKPSAIALPPVQRSLELEQVRFRYEATEPWVLDGVSLSLPVGSVVALVGSSGSGKTTIANLIPRFYDVNEGTIRIDGHDVRDVQLGSLRQQIAIVSQDTFLFNASVADNIAYGATGIGQSPTLEDIQRAARAAHAETFVEALSDGYETIVGERGELLSGGQKQRLAIARALLRDAPLLVLDEATSSLDVESERFVQEALDALMVGRTSLVIAHRLSTIQRADAICVLKEGKIVEQGKHEDLLGRGGEYARLYDMQFRPSNDPQEEP